MSDELKTANELLREAQEYYMQGANKCPYEVRLRERISAYLDAPQQSGEGK